MVAQGRNSRKKTTEKTPQDEEIIASRNLSSRVGVGRISVAQA